MNLMIASADAAPYGVLLLYLLLRYQMIANPRKTRNWHLIDTRNQNQSYGTLYMYMCMYIQCTCICIYNVHVYVYTMYMYMYTCTVYV